MLRKSKCKQSNLDCLAWGDFPKPLAGSRGCPGAYPEVCHWTTQDTGSVHQRSGSARQRPSGLGALALVSSPVAWERPSAETPASAPSCLLPSEITVFVILKLEHLADLCDDRKPSITSKLPLGSDPLPCVQLSGAEMSQRAAAECDNSRFGLIV